MNQTLTALIRTYVPILIGTVLSFLATSGVKVDDNTHTLLVTGVTGLLIAAYYTVVHSLETRWPVFSLLLGSTARPTYNTAVSTETVPSPAPATQDAPKTLG